MSNDGWNDAFRDYGERLLDEMGPSMPEAAVALIDALRNYIRADADLAKNLLYEGSITRTQFDAGQKDLVRYVAILKELEKWEIDPSLQGLLRVSFRETG